MFLKKTQVDVENFFHERIMSMVSQELVLKCQCKQRECVQSREAHFSSNVGFQQRLVKHVCVRVAIAVVKSERVIQAAQLLQSGMHHSCSVTGNRQCLRFSIMNYGSQPLLVPAT